MNIHNIFAPFLFYISSALYVYDFCLSYPGVIYNSTCSAYNTVEKISSTHNVFGI